MSSLKKNILHFILLATMGFSPFLLADSLTEEEIERWLNSDDSGPPNYQNVNVNEGDLIFLEVKPSKLIHHHSNTLTLYKTSLKDGWVKLKQCHNNLDRVARIQVMFNKNKIRGLKVLKSDEIEKAWVEDNTVQLENVKANALLCIEAWSKALVANKDGSYRLTNGPFMRKFLDGYFPIHVTIEVDFEDTNLKLLSIEPIAQNGFNISRTAKTVNMDAWFEGRLQTNLTFVN